MDHRRPSTIKDVASLAGVSTTTVSHVLNEVPGKRINGETRDRVKLAADQLSYSPNRVAQGLRLQRTHTFGFVSDAIGATPYAGLTILGAQRAAAEKGSLLMFMNSGLDPELEEREIRALLDRRVDGIIYASDYHRQVTLPPSIRRTAAVLLDATTQDPSISSVVPDEVGGALDAVRELAMHGHREIGFLNDRDDIPATRLRQAGFMRGLEEIGVPFRSDMMISEQANSAGGYRAALRLLDRPDRPTALFCFNDRTAMGAYQAAADLGLRIPDDLSIVGFDNQENIADGLLPGLTTMALPHYEMGQWAVRTLIDLVDSRFQQPAPQVVTLPCPLVRRASVGSPPGR
jgi:LacI family transcriptional regulator